MGQDLGGWQDDHAEKDLQESETASRQGLIAEMNGTGNPIRNDAGSVTGYVGAWVCANAGDDPGVQPARRPTGPPFKNKEWNGKATAIENEEGVVTAYAGAWVHGDPQDESSAVQPAKRPNHRPKKGMVWNDKAHAMKNEP